MTVQSLRDWKKLRPVRAGEAGRRAIEEALRDLMGSRRSSASAAGRLGVGAGVGLGVLLGAGAALFLAPRTGRDLRDGLVRLRNEARDLAGRAATRLRRPVPRP